MGFRKGLVSVVMPTYNRADFLPEAIESVIAQSYEYWQLIIIDDGSTDDTKSLIASYLQDSRILYYYQKNQGQSVARQKALTLADGEFVAFLDSDNRWFPDRLLECVTTLNTKPEYAIAYADGVLIDEHGATISTRNMRRYSGNITNELLKDNCVSMNTTLVRRDALEDIGGFRPEVRRADDYDLWLRLSAKYQFIYISKRLSEYRVMEDQISSNKDGRFASNYEIINNFHKTFPNAVTTLQRRRAWSSFYCRKAAYEASMKRRLIGLGDTVKAFTYFPFWQGPWRVLIKQLIGRYS